MLPPVLVSEALNDLQRDEIVAAWSHAVVERVPGDPRSAIDEYRIAYGPKAGPELREGVEALLWRSGRTRPGREIVVRVGRAG